MTSNLFLNDLLLRLDFYMGTYSCNNIPDSTWEKNFLIINLSKVNTLGSHFICLYIYKNRNKWYVEYFDPLGGPCRNKYILHYISNYSKYYKMSTRPVQSMFSIRCGFFCATYVMYRGNALSSFSKFINLFDNVDLKKNDKFVDEFILLKME